MKLGKAMELFRHEERTGLFNMFKTYSFIIYKKKIRVKAPGKFPSTIKRHEIHNIYFCEEVLRGTNDKWTTMLSLIDKAGELYDLPLDDSDYNNLSIPLKEFDIEGFYKLNKKPISDTIRWFTLACGIFFNYTGRDRGVFGGFVPDEPAKKLCTSLLNDSWGIYDEKTGIEMCESLLLDRHNDTFFSKKDKIKIFQEICDNCGEHNIAAWDLVRAIYVSTDCYMAGYFNYEQAYDYCLRVAKKLQSLFNN